MAKDKLTPAEKRRKTMASKKAAEDVRNLYQKAAGGRRREWQAIEQRSYDFFLNSQLNHEELQALEDAGMPSFIINRITPVIETMRYFVTANSPRWKAVGVDGADTSYSEIETGVIDYCWYISGGDAMLAMVTLDTLVKSKGYVHLYVDPDADNGLGEVKFERVDPFHVYTDPRSCDPYERDATYQIIKKDLPREMLKRFLPEFEDEISRATGEPDDQYFSERDFEELTSFQPGDMEDPIKPKDGKEDDLLPYYEVYTPKKYRFYNVFVERQASPKEITSAARAIDAEIERISAEMQVQLIEKELELRQAMEAGEIVPERYNLELQKAADEAQSTIQNQRHALQLRLREESTKVEQRIVSEQEYEELKRMDVKIREAIEFFDQRIEKRAVVGDKFLYSAVLPVKHSPLISLPYTFTGTPLPMSAVTPLVGKQQEINKAHQIMVHNANLSSNMRWLYVEGEIDVDYWEDYNASPSAMLPYRPGFSASGPREIMPQNINNAFFTIEHESKSDLEYMAGIQPPSMGISSGSGEDTYRGFLAKDEYGTRRIRSWASNVLEPFLEHVAGVFQRLAKDTYTIHKVFRIVQPNPNGSFEAREVEINVPIYNDYSDEIGRWNDYSTERYDLRLIAGSTLPVNRWAVLEEYKQYFELGLIDDIAFISETDIKNKDALLQRKSMMTEMRQQIASMEEAIKNRDGTIETLQRQLVQAGIKGKIQDAEMEVDRSRTELKMSDKLMQERMRDALKTSRDKMQMELEKLKLEVQKLQSETNKKTT